MEIQYAKPINLPFGSNINTDKYHNTYGKFLTILEDGSKLYYGDSNKIFNIRNWEGQRQIDVERAREISKCIKQTECVPGMIHCAEIQRNGKTFLRIFDGGHRVYASKLLYEETNNIYKILLRVVKNTNDDLVKKEFYELNMSICVPELYLDELDGKNDKFKNIIQNVVKDIKDKFPNMFSEKRNYQRPNMNRDELVDKLFKRIKEIDNNNIEWLTETTLLDNIYSLNEQYKRGKFLDLNDSKKYSKGMLDKCKKHGCYLFLKKDFVLDLL